MPRGQPIGGQSCWLWSMWIVVATPGALAADERPAPTASDRPAATQRRTFAPSAEDVARELYDLQQSQGGSVVEEMEVEQFSDESFNVGEFGVELGEPTPPQRRRAAEPTSPRSGRRQRHWFHLSRPTPERPVDWDAVASDAPAAPTSRQTPAVLLRQSAWKLERVAQQLEMSELFSEADAVRDVAHHLRMAARRPRLAP